MGLIVIICILGIIAVGLVSPWLARLFGAATGKVLALVPLACFGYFCTLVRPIAEGQVVAWEFAWVPAVQANFAIWVDGLSLLFLLIISLVGTFISAYAGDYLKGDPRHNRFFLYLFAFMGAMLGVVVADNLFLLFIFWELTSISSYLLIGYYHDQEESRKSALQAMLVTGAGGLVMLAGLVLLGLVGGSFRISDLNILHAETVLSSPLYPAILILLLIGAFTKSAQFPFHFWLPNAMAAPAPVSAFLHSATMVKAGVFLLARLHPSLSGHELWVAIVAPVGAATMLAGVLLAMGQSDLKRILAYTTLAVLGTLTLLLGLGFELAVKACMVYLLAHALYKAALFMAAGSVDHETGTRDVGQLRGLMRKMPYTAAAAFIGALSMAGIPLFLGFISKEYYYKALLEAPGIPWLWPALGVFASILMFSLALTAGIRPFIGRFIETPKHAHEAPWAMWLGPIILGLLAIKFGLFPGWVGENLIAPATGAVIGQHNYQASLSLWHGWNLALALSIFTALCGVIVFFLARHLREARGIYRWLGHYGAEAAYFRSLEAMLSVAKWQTGFFQNGYLRYYIMTIMAAVGVTLAILLIRTPLAFDFASTTPVNAPAIMMSLITICAAIYVCIAATRLTALIALGVVGMGVALLFVLFSAPDLAMTQILVETLTVLLFVLAFFKLPRFQNFSGPGTRIRDIAIAAGVGTLMATLVLVAFVYGANSIPVSQHMGEISYTLAHGRNVVNVILVDFRALDTLGEITVLGIAALGVFALLKLRPRRENAKEDKS